MTKEQFINELDLNPSSIKLHYFNNKAYIYSSNGFLLDNNQGYGYKDAKAAYRCYYYKVKNGYTSGLIETAWSSYLDSINPQQSTALF